MAQMIHDADYQKNKLLTAIQLFSNAVIFLSCISPMEHL